MYYVDQTDNRVVKYQTRGLRNIETGANIEKIVIRKRSLLKYNLRVAQIEGCVEIRFQIKGLKAILLKSQMISQGVLSIKVN